MRKTKYFCNNPIVSYIEPYELRYMSTLNTVLLHSDCMSNLFELAPLGKWGTINMCMDNN